MSRRHVRGRARLLPDEVNTDYIISSHRKRETSDPGLLTPYLLEDLPRPLDEPLMAGDIIVAGRNFGCGSAMEIAVDVIMAAGVPCVIAESTARTFFRNAVNAGLPILILRKGRIREGDELDIVLRREPTVTNITRGSDIVCSPIPSFALNLIRAGGLLAYCRERGMFPRGPV